MIIDFGKACFEIDGKAYSLSSAEKLEYSKHHPQIAPDLRDGYCKQCKASDIYSFGRIISAICKNKLPLPALISMSEMCLEFSKTKRPTTNELCTFLKNLFEV